MVEGNHIVQLHPLNADDVATIHRISHTPAVMKSIEDAWQQSSTDGHERGFFIYRDGERYFTGEMVTGSENDLRPLYASLVRANALKGDPAGRGVVSYAS